MNAEAKVLATPIPGDDDPRPVVALPRPGLPGVAIAGVSGVLALLLFLVLDGRREAGEASSPRERRQAGAAFSAPPPLAVPAEQPEYRQQADLPPLRVVQLPAQTLRLPAPVRMTNPAPRMRPAPVAEPYYEPVGSPEEPLPEPPAMSFEEPALVMDAGGAGRGAARGPAARAGGSDPAGGEGGSGAAGADAASPRLGTISDPGTVMAVGTLIQAVLETPIDTAKPGLARAIVSRDARGFDGRQVLVPRGSRLTGEYQSDARAGQKKVLINWTQLIRPDGSVIRLDSPAADALGGAGVPGRTSGLSLGRLAQGVLRTALAVGTGVASWSGRGSVIVGLPGAQLTNAVGGAGGKGRQRRITVKQGTMFNVFVARNLDFSAALPSR